MPYSIVRFKNSLNTLFETPQNFSHLSDIISSGFSVGELTYRFIFHYPNDNKATP